MDTIAIHMPLKHGAHQLAELEASGMKIGGAHLETTPMPMAKLQLCAHNADVLLEKMKVEVKVG